MLKCVGGRGSAPDPAGGAHDTPPDRLVCWGGGHPIPSAVGASVTAPAALVFRLEPYHFLKRSGAHEGRSDLSSIAGKINPL